MDQYLPTKTNTGFKMSRVVYHGKNHLTLDSRYHVAELAWDLVSL